LVARPTTDAKPKLFTLRLSAADVRSLSRLAKQEKCSMGEVLRRLLRAQTRKK